MLWRRPGSILLLAVLVGRAGEACAWQATPILQLDALGGQLFYQDPRGKNTSSSGLGTWLGSVGISLPQGDTLLATLSGQYLDRNQVAQIGGGGALTTHTLDNGFLARWLHAVSASWTIKPDAFYKNETLSTTANESFGAGIFDYHKYGGGIEAEWKKGKFSSVRQYLSAYQVNYYHYQGFRTTLPGRELQQDRALDFTAYEYTVSVDYLASPGTLLSASGQGSYRYFPGESLVQVLPANAPLFDTPRRRDLAATGFLGLTQQLPETWRPVEGSAGFNAGYSLLDSNQNDFDQTQVHFNPNFYSYREYPAGAWLSATLKDGLSANLAYAYARRAYLARPLQAADGTYPGGLIRTDTHNVSLALAYPLAKGFSAKALTAYTSSSSNMQFTGGYLYNYHYTYYFLGLGYSL